MKVNLLYAKQMRYGPSPNVISSYSQIVKSSLALLVPVFQLYGCFITNHSLNTRNYASRPPQKHPWLPGGSRTLNIPGLLLTLFLGGLRVGLGRVLSLRALLAAEWWAFLILLPSASQVCSPSVSSTVNIFKDRNKGKVSQSNPITFKSPAFLGLSWNLGLHSLNRSLSQGSRPRSTGWTCVLSHLSPSLRPFRQLFPEYVGSTVYGIFPIFNMKVSLETIYLSF